MTNAESQERDLLQKSLLPCPHCNASGRLEKKGNSISYWLVRCDMCRASVKGTTALQAYQGWNSRPSNIMVRLGESGFLLPGGQKWSYVMVHERAANGDQPVSFIDWMDGEVVGQIDVNLGHFFLARWMKDDEQHVP